MDTLNYLKNKMENNFDSISKLLSLKVLMTKDAEIELSGTFDCLGNDGVSTSLKLFPHDDAAMGRSLGFRNAAMTQNLET